MIKENFILEEERVYYVQEVDTGEQIATIKSFYCYQEDIEENLEDLNDDLRGKLLKLKGE